MVTNEHAQQDPRILEGLVRIGRSDLAQIERDGSDTEPLAAADRDRFAHRVFTCHVRAIGFAIIRAKRGRGALKDLPSWRGLQQLA